jgi:hypothetical protein
MVFMAERVSKERVNRENGWLYYIDVDGYVYRKKQGIFLSKTEKIGKEKIVRDDGYLYFVDSEGYVARMPKTPKKVDSGYSIKYPSGVTVSTWKMEEGKGRKPLIDKSSKDRTDGQTGNKKYLMLSNDTIKAPFGERTLFRIQAKKSFGSVKKGDKGGYIENEDNLSSEGKAWISDHAKVFGKARISGNAQVYGDAMVYSEAEVSDNAEVYGNAKVNGSSQIYGNAKIYGNSEIYGDAQVKDNAEVYDNAKVKGNALIYENAKIYAKGWVGFNQKIGGSREVIRDIMIDEMR